MKRERGQEAEVLQTWAFWGQLQHNFLDRQATSPWPFILGCTWPHLLCFLQTTVNSVKEVSPRLESLYMWVYCFFPSELQKYQKMLEPPPSAKPFIVDVDKKLEEGQKVTSFLRYQSFHLRQFPALYPWFTWGQDAFCAILESGYCILMASLSNFTSLQMVLWLL